MSEVLEDRPTTAAIHPLKFWTEYDQAGAPHDWVEWAKRGAQSPTTTSEKIIRVKRDASVWQAIRGAYDAWKAGESAPVNGTPLDSLPFVSRDQAETLARVHVRSAEDLAALEDAALSRLNVRDLRALKQKALLFLQARASAAPIMDEVMRLRAEIEEMRQAATASKRGRKAAGPANAEESEGGG